MQNPPRCDKIDTVPGIVPGPKERFRFAFLKESRSPAERAAENGERPAFGDVGQSPTARPRYRAYTR